MFRLDAMVFGNRIYVITGRNKLLCGVLSTLTATQLCFGFFSVVRIAMHPGKFLDPLLILVRTQIGLQRYNFRR